MAPIALSESLNAFTHGLATALDHITRRNTMSTRSTLSKRDNMGFAIPPMAIVILIIFGAGLFVCMAYAVHKLMGFPGAGAESTFGRGRTSEQDDYMREVRARNLDGLWSGMYGKRDMGTGRERMAAKRHDSEWSDGHSSNMY